MDFCQTAKAILNGYGLNINGAVHRICEVEVYLKSDAHQDLYVHTGTEQQVYGGWYFHRHSNGTYKGGTFKGLDFTLGSPGVSYCYLIRSIFNGQKMIEGPCNVVNYILTSFGKTSIIELTNNMLTSCFHGPLCLVQISPQNDIIYCGRRVGLSDKYPMYRDLPYRFLIYKHQIKKQKTGLMIV